METTITETSGINSSRTQFIEALSHQFISLTGCGIYVYLNPIDINSLFNQYINDSMPLRAFARQCVKNVM
jgi:hypothetical protein